MLSQNSMARVGGGSSRRELEVSAGRGDPVNMLPGTRREAATWWTPVEASLNGMVSTQYSLQSKYYVLEIYYKVDRGSNLNFWESIVVCITLRLSMSLVILLGYNSQPIATC